MREDTTAPDLMATQLALAPFLSTDPNVVAESSSTSHSYVMFLC